MKKYYEQPLFVAPKREGLSDEAYINFFLERFYTESEVNEWWHSVQVQLDGKTPAEAWKSGHDSVIKLIEEVYVNWTLEMGYNELGIRQWWERQRVQLGMKTPTEVWTIDREKVMRLAETLQA